MMQRRLLLIGGILNAVMTIFHVWLGYQIHRITGISVELQALMEMLNAGGTLLILFFAVGSLAFPTDVLTTRLGRSFLVLVVVLYFSRAVEEVLLSPSISFAIIGVCIAIAVVYAIPILKKEGTPA
jgi:hypothetical protein